MIDTSILNDLKNMYKEERDVGGLVYIPVEELHAHPDNPRKEIGDVTELAESIKAKGIMQNLTVVPRAEGGYTVIIGHRRSAAAKAAGLSAVPCVVVEMSEREQVATMLLENMQRVDLTAYEQAQGFQMMIDFGDTVEGIAEKTGFSKRTVRGRLKMAELDSTILRDVSSSRQISIADVDKLSQLEDIEKRNELLKMIGTNNFEQALTRAVKQQKINHALPFAREAVKALKCKKIERSETYGSKYRKIYEVLLEHWKSDSKINIPEKYADEKLFYYIDEFWGNLNIYVLAPKEAPVKKSKGEIAREKQIKEAHATLSHLTSEFYILRYNFIKDFKVTKDNEAAVKAGAFLALLSEQHWYNTHINKRGIYTDCGGVEGIIDQYMTDKVLDGILEAFRKDPKRLYPSMIYVSFGDTNGECFYTTSKWEYPRHADNRKLKMLYEWLISLGYEMSDEEKSLIDGTHPIFKRGTNDKI